MADILDLILSQNKVEESADTLNVLAQSYHAYDVTLKRPTKQATFGFGYRCIQANTGLIITVMCENTVVTSWNKICDLSETICVGDRILSVNGEADAKQMVQELRKAQEVKMRILKAGPRWHLDGATAECMRKIDWAMAKGLRFETRALEETSRAKHPAGVISRPSCTHFLFLLLGIICPLMFMCVFFSYMFFGIQIYTMLAPWYYNMAGNFVASMAALYGVGLYVADWSTWSSHLQKFISAAVLLYGFCFAFILKCRFYPFSPLIICLFHIVIVIGVMRASLLRHLSRGAFYRVVYRTCFVGAIFVLGMWLVWLFVGLQASPSQTSLLPLRGVWDGNNLYNSEMKDRLAEASRDIYKAVKITVNGEDRELDYEHDCDEDRDEAVKQRDWMVNSTTGQRVWRTTSDGNGGTVYALLEADEANDRDNRCAQVKTIWFLQWVSPLVAFGTCIIISGFSFLNTFDYTQDATGIEKLIKGAITVVCVILMTMWLSTSLAAASMALTSTLAAFCASAMAALMIWIYLEIGKRAITSTIKESKIMNMLVALATSNVVRAFLVAVFGVLIPIGYLLAMLNQKVRKIRGTATSDGKLTDGAEKVLKALTGWCWGNILIKANLWVMLYYTFMIGVSKWTVVFLSWLNGTLAEVDLIVVLVVFFVIGFIMFLLPPVPGVPVYVTSGVVIAARASQESLGFWGGVGIAMALSFVLKLVACTGQYMIGYFMGKSVKIQQMVGVDKIPMRSIERILLTRGLSPAKVSVLVGGPDWPTSVVCGILRLNLLQILLGTTPVIFVSSPCVIAGAFLSGPQNADGETDSAQEKGTLNTIASTLLAVSIFLQGMSMLLAGYFIQDTVSKHSAELSKYRPEHQPVVELTQKEAEANAAWNDVLYWDMMSKRDKVLIITSVGLCLLSLFFFIFLDETCHRNFQVNNKISDSFGQQGLDNNALNIVQPVGWVANGLFATGCVLHVIFVKVQSRKAAAHLKFKRENPKTSVKRTLKNKTSTSAPEGGMGRQPSPDSQG